MSASDAFLKGVLARIQSGACDHCALTVVDLGGRLLLAWRPQAVGFFYADLSRSKAWTAAALRRSPDVTGPALIERPAAAAFLSGVGDGQCAPLEGGALLLQGAEPVCGVGVAGPQGGRLDREEIQTLASLAGLSVHDGSLAPAAAIVGRATRSRRKSGPPSRSE